MGEIVIGVDGSEPSRRALRWALNEARLRDEVVVHTYGQLRIRNPYESAYPYIPGDTFWTDPLRPVEGQPPATEVQTGEFRVLDASYAQLVAEVGSAGHRATVIVDGLQPTNEAGEERQWRQNHERQPEGEAEQP